MYSNIQRKTSIEVYKRYVLKRTRYELLPSSSSNCSIWCCNPYFKKWHLIFGSSIWCLFVAFLPSDKTSFMYFLVAARPIFCSIHPINFALSSVRQFTCKRRISDSEMKNDSLFRSTKFISRFINSEVIYRCIDKNFTVWPIFFPVDGSQT